MAELSKDPDNNGKVTPKSTNEAGVMLDMEDAGRLPGPVRRPNRQMGESGDVVDASGQQWDIKSLKDRATIRQIRIAKGQPVPPPHVPLRGEFDVATEIQRLRGQIASGEKVIFDMRGISAADQLTLRNAVTQAGLDAHVLYYP